MRNAISLNRGWQFTGPDASEQAVDLPHTWNNIDGQDGGNDYWRGTCHYRRTFPRPAAPPSARISLICWPTPTTCP